STSCVSSLFSAATLSSRARAISAACWCARSSAAVRRRASAAVPARAANPATTSTTPERAPDRLFNDHLLVRAIWCPGAAHLVDGGRCRGHLQREADAGP